MTKPWTPPTLDEYRALNLTRPLTDGPVGENASRRNLDARTSAAISDVLGPIDAAVAAARRHGDALPQRPAELPPGSEKRGPIPETIRKPIEHGTASGYRLHRRRGEEACDACKAAHATAQAIRQEARRLAS